MKSASLRLSLDPESNRDLQRGPLAFGFRPAIMPLYHQSCCPAHNRLLFFQKRVNVPPKRISVHLAYPCNLSL